MLGKPSCLLLGKQMPIGCVHTTIPRYHTVVVRLTRPTPQYVTFNLKVLILYVKIHLENVHVKKKMFPP